VSLLDLSGEIPEHAKMDIKTHFLAQGCDFVLHASLVVSIEPQVNNSSSDEASPRFFFSSQTRRNSNKRKRKKWIEG
jgi:hypothetical protein